MSKISFNSYLEERIVLEQIPPSKLPSVKDLQVLVVDDNNDALFLVKFIFEGCQAEVKTATSVDNAIQIMEQWKPDVLISDLGMPDKDGYSLIRFIRNQEACCGGFLPALALTSYVDSEYLNTAMDAGFQSVISKPFDPDELVASVAKLALGC